jgi:hypothetical protein
LGLKSHASNPSTVAVTTTQNPVTSSHESGPDRIFAAWIGVLLRSQDFDRKMRRSTAARTPNASRR